MTDRLLYCGDHRSQKKRRDQRLLPARSPLPPCTFVCFTLKMNINFFCPNRHMYLRTRLELTTICFLSNCNHIVWTVSLLCIGDNDFFGWIISLSKAWFETHYTFNSRQLEFPFFFNLNDNLSFFLVFFIWHELDIRDVFEPLRDITQTTPDLFNSRWMMGCAIFGFHHHVIVYSIPYFKMAAILVFFCSLAN